MRVAILGCGPAGLMAAHAAKLAGAEDIRIFSKKRKSELFGAQYLHHPIPGMTEKAPVTVKYSLKGTHDEYRKKVYDDEWDGAVSTEDYEGSHDAWDIRTTYANLWERYQHLITNIDITTDWVRWFLLLNVEKFDHIFSTVPKHLLCRQVSVDLRAHQFTSQNVWAAGDAPERGLFVDVEAGRVLPNNTVLCSGDPDDEWYRVARVFGYTTIEWPPYAVPHWPDVPPVPSAVKVTKPLANSCDCWPQITPLGRYGKWEKGVLADSAFQDVMDLMVVSQTS